MNNTAKHTPGPWVVKPHSNEEARAIWSSKGEVIGLCATKHAHLIAAAPAMYEALKRIKVLMESGDIEGRDWVEYGHIINALAQAEGRQA